jgi:hypothetical protein
MDSTFTSSRVPASPPLQISAKDLGDLALDDFCPRCFWLGRHLALPYQRGFPGIFSSIDSYTKSVVNERIRQGAGIPPWLAELGDVEAVTEPHYRTFRTVVEGVTLTGSMDALFQMADGSYAVIDYKTARSPRRDRLDELMPIYHVQLNGYALIAEALGHSPVDKLALVYFEPPDPADRPAFDAAAKKYTLMDGFAMPFTPHVEWVEKDTNEVRRLAKRAGKIYAASSPPAGQEGCENCAKLAGVMAVVRGE